MTDLTIPNGLVWSEDGGRAFHVDTPRGHPDGMALDAHEGLWVAMWGGSAVHRYCLDGHLTAVVEVGAAQVSSCAFGGPGDTHLYITTSRQGLGDAKDPTAGAVFWVDVDVEGAPVATYAA